MPQGSNIAHRGEAVELILSLPVDISAAAIARRAVSEKLVGISLSNDLLADILLATSELVTNAIEHGQGPYRLRLAQSATTIRIEVYDGSPSRPLVKKTTPLEPRSRGLRLVAALASGRWGYAKESGGKQVWAEFTMDNSHQG